VADPARPDAEPQHLVPRVLRVSAALGWRLLVVLVAVGVIGWVIGKLSLIAVPVAVALLLAALFAPLVEQLRRWHVPKALATIVALVVGITVVAGLLTLVISAFTRGLPQLQAQVSQSIETIRDWLRFGPLHLSSDQLQAALNRLGKLVRANPSGLASRALSTVATIGGVLTGLLLAVFTLVFFLYDGERIWGFLLGASPSRVRDRIDVAGRRSFASLVGYVRATILVALGDDIGIGIGLWLVGVPLVVRLAALVFLAAFVPIVGGVLAGAVAVLVALVANGLVAALVVLAIVIAVMQIEGHVLQPLLLGRAVRLHPLAVVLGVATGVVVAGIVGALLAVPLLAVLHSGIGSLRRDPPLDPGEVHPVRSHARAAIPLAAADPERGGENGPDERGGEHATA
jgi:predicted PurR-regulated permease PerM